MAFTKAEFMTFMHFAPDWVTLDMYPPDEAFFNGQRDVYQPGSEKASEHFRNAAFHWWLKRHPSKEHLKKLVRLTYVDEDRRMGEWLRSEIAKAANCDSEIAGMLQAVSARH